MLTTTFLFLQFASFVGLLILFWRVSKWPKWRVRVVICGWASVFLWAFLWAVIFPMSLRGVMNSKMLADTFPDGTIAAGALVGGWVYPMIVVAISAYQDRKKAENDHVT